MDFFPFSLNGPQFLIFFAVFALICGLIALATKPDNPLGKRRPSGPAVPVRDVKIDVYEAAYLESGPEGPVNAALAGLMADGFLRPPTRANRVGRHGPPPVTFRSDFERWVYDAIDDGLTGTSIPEIYRALAQRTSAIAASLRAMGLIHTPRLEKRGFETWHAVLLVPLVLAAVRIVQGLSRGRPVLLLVVVAGAYAAIVPIICWAGVSLTTRRTVLGLAVLARLRRRNASLGQAAKRGVQLRGQDAAVVVALFGAGLFTAGGLQALGRGLAFVPPFRGDGGAWGCGGGGCGGGGGCAGGCGGCGG